jgi:DNA invertase Pin-like site-specific DNA recombinase
MRCLLYARVSTDRQAQMDLSIPAQLQLMREHAKRQGWSVVGQYLDEGESARTANRPELKRLLHHCQQTKGVEIVLVHKLDRLARNVVDYATIKTILKRRGIRLVSVVEQFDDGPVGHLLENIIASISEWYSANLGEEIKKSSFAKIQRGEWPHGPAFGYRSVREETTRKIRHVEDPDTAPLIRQAFELYATGQHSLRGLAEEMGDRGLRTRPGKPYSAQLLKKLLRRRFYIGKIVWNGKEYPGKHPAIVPADLFYRVQDMLKRRQRDTGDKGRLFFLLRGVATCQSCGQRLTAERHARGTYYRCLEAVQCREPYVPVKRLENQLEALYERLQPGEKVLRLVRLEIQAIAERRQETAEREVSRLHRTLATVEAKELRLTDELVSGQVSRDAYEKLAARYIADRRATEGRLSQLDVDYRDPLDFFDKCLVVASTLTYLHRQFDPSRRKMLLRALFERIIVHDRAITGVTLRPPFSFFLGDAASGLFEKPPPGHAQQDKFEQKFEGPPPGHAQQDIFEQLVAFSLSVAFGHQKDLIAALLGAESRVHDELAA